jgi:hypothetical protein
VYFRPEAKICPPDVSINRDGTVTFALCCSDELAWGEILETVSEEVGMGVSEYEGPKLHNRDEAGEVHDFGVGVAAVENTGEVEEFGALVDFGPESLLEGLFGVAKGSGFFD